VGPGCGILVFPDDEHKIYLLLLKEIRRESGNLTSCILLPSLVDERSDVSMRVFGTIDREMKIKESSDGNNVLGFFLFLVCFY